MLEEVRGAVSRVGFGPATGINPHTNGRCLSIGRVLCCDLDSQHERGGHGGKKALTVRPFDSVVHWVVAGSETGEAKLRLGRTAFMAARLRKAWLKLKASRRAAIVGFNRQR